MMAVRTIVKKNDPTKCCRCLNKNYMNCSVCKGDSNFIPMCTYEEWKKRRKEETRRTKK